MNIRPIPASLLKDSITLLVPYSGGYHSITVEKVRVCCRSRVSEYSAAIMRDTSEITVYYDCEQSYPSHTEFSAGMLIMYDGARYEVLSAETFSADVPHHIRITAKRV